MKDTYSVQKGYEATKLIIVAHMLEEVVKLGCPFQNVDMMHNTKLFVSTIIRQIQRNQVKLYITQIRRNQICLFVFSLLIFIPFYYIEIRTQILHNGLLFYKHYVSNDRHFWRCKRNGATIRCPARLVTDSNGVTEVNCHNHNDVKSDLSFEDFFGPQSDIDCVKSECL